MENENQEKKVSALEQLKALRQSDRISTLDIKEPELFNFDATSIFEVDEKPQEEQPKRKSMFGKRSQRSVGEVKVKTTAFENEGIEVEDVMVTSGLKRVNRIVEKPVSFDDEPVLTEEVEEVKPVVEEPMEEVTEEVVQPEPVVEEIVEELPVVETISEPVEEVEPTVELESVEEVAPVIEEVSAETEPLQTTVERPSLEDLIMETPQKEVHQESGLEGLVETIATLDEVVPTEPEETEEVLEESEEEIPVEEVEEQETLEEVVELDEEESFETEENVEEDVENEDDLFVEKKRFLLSQFEKMETYLETQSDEGYHFVRQVGKKFYFRQGQPRDYYYSINYFKEEPDADTWREWERDGWKLVSKSPGKSKKEAGWFIFRNEEKQGEYRKEIDNDTQKFQFFKKYSNSCRSTMFLIFICMLCCVVAAYLQWMFKGYLVAIIACAVLFVLSLIVFFMYGRMLRHSKKAVAKLKAKVRMKERELAMNDYHDEASDETQEQLDTDWNQLETEISQSRKKRRKMRR